MLAVNWQALLEPARPLRLYDLCLARRFAPLGGSVSTPDVNLSILAAQNRTRLRKSPSV